MLEIGDISAYLNNIGIIGLFANIIDQLLQAGTITLHILEETDMPPRISRA